jgi:pimeloyl-ACP methyl ester carboxylesterase
MPTLETKHGPIWWELADLTPPWLENAPAILFHHGIGASMAIFAEWLPVLAGRYRIVRFDMRGYGRSPEPPASYLWSADGMLADLFAVADAAGLERFHLVGESVGGTIALLAAARAPKRVLTATGVSCSHRGAAIAHVAEWERFFAEKGFKAWSDDFMPKRFHPGGIGEAQWRWFSANQAKGQVASTMGPARMLMGADIGEDLRRIRQPALLLHPDGSPFVSPAIAAEMKALIPGSELMIFPHARHGLSLSHGPQCAAALTDFLARRASAP